VSKSKKEAAAAGRKPSYRVALALHDDVSSIAKMAESLDRLARLEVSRLSLPENHLHVKLLGFPSGKQGVRTDALLAAYKTACQAAWLVQWYGPEHHAGIDFTDFDTVREAALRHAVERHDDALVFVGLKATHEGVREAVEAARAGKGTFTAPGLFCANVVAFTAVEEREIEDLGEIKKGTMRVALLDKLKAAMGGGKP